MVPSELLGANLMFDNDTELLVAIFQEYVMGGMSRQSFIR
jgi:hypothetical protein